MPPTSISAFVETDDILRCDPAPLLRLIAAGRHIWAPGPGRVTLWRDDVTGDDGAASLSPAVIGYWSATLRQAQLLPYALLPGGRCVTEMFIAGCGPGTTRIDGGLVVIDEMSALMTLEQWGKGIRRSGERNGADPDVVERHVERLTAFLRKTVTWG